MKKSIYMLFMFVVLFISACAQSPKSFWYVIDKQDQFTDKRSVMVATGDYATEKHLVTSYMRIYPFVGLYGENNELVVGIRSGGKLAVPVGAVQIRIDDNSAWTITPTETPTDMSLVSSMPQKYDNPNFNTQEAQDVYKNLMTMTAQSISPYTVATGDKAKAIIKQMLQGKKMIYRQVGLGQATSTTGQVPLDDSFTESMRNIGITLDNLK